MSSIPNNFVVELTSGLILIFKFFPPAEKIEVHWSLFSPIDKEMKTKPFKENVVVALFSASDGHKSVDSIVNTSAFGIRTHPE